MEGFFICLGLQNGGFVDISFAVAAVERDLLNTEILVSKAYNITILLSNLNYSSTNIVRMY